MIKRIINIFTLRKEERYPVLTAMAFFIVLNIINVCGYWYRFSVPAGNYHKLFVNAYRLSGFDPLTYEVISRWIPAYNIYRHPLLAFFMYPFYLLNQGLISITGVNCATIITALILVGCSTYSFVFLFRILRNVICISLRHTLVVAMMYFSFGFILLSSMAPDHFVMSQCCLLLTVWLAGEKLKRGSALNMWQTIALFVLTAGVSLNNGLKVFLAALVTRRQRFFRWRYLLFAVVMPSALMWGVAEWEYKTWQWPREQKLYEIKIRKDKEATQRLRKQITDTISDKSTEAIEREVKRVKQEREEAKKRANLKKPWIRNTGTPMADSGFMHWTDKSTSRVDAIVENLFGEGIQLHRDYALGDVLRNRPVVVRYSGLWRYCNYTVEAIIVALFAFGLWCGRRRLFMWTAMSCFIMDMALHLGLGFGINEIYIMSAHYLFVVPIAVAYIIKANERQTVPRRTAVALVAFTGLWCLVWNLTVIGTFFAS